jgi:RNA polymerase sigma-70 factor (ECF subfamily)
VEFQLSAPLLPRIALGDTTAVDAFLDRYGALVWSLASRLSPTNTDAEDAVQEIFIHLWRNAGRYREDVGEEVTFVSTIARRKLIDRQRKLRRDVAYQSVEEQELGGVGNPDLAAIENSDDSRRAVACLGKLRETERQVIELSVYHGLPQARIAEQTGTPLGTVKSLIRRGLLQLRNCMKIGPRLRAEGGVSI